MLSVSVRPVGLSTMAGTFPRRIFLMDFDCFLTVFPDRLT
jgi:hypothetical protein